MKGPGLVVSDKNIFKDFPMNKSPSAQRRSPGYDVQRFKKIFKKLPITEADKPKGRAIVTRVHNFNNLGKGTLGDTTYQISKL